MNSRDDPDKTYKVALPDNNYATVYLRDAMSVEEFLANACARKNLNPMEHFVRVKKRRDMEDHNYFVPHRNDLIETYVSITHHFATQFSTKVREENEKENQFAAMNVLTPFTFPFVLYSMCSVPWHGA